MAYLMKCGHVGNSLLLTKEGAIPYCAICGNTVVDKEVHGKVGLEGRKARCTQHRGIENSIVDSDWDLAFFRYCPDKEYDEYYCGCWGWD